MAQQCEPIPPGASFDRTQDHLHWLPLELLTEQIHKHVLTFDHIVITSAARQGVKGRVLDDEIKVAATAPATAPTLAAATAVKKPESTFSFSSRYACSISARSTVNQYRWTVQEYIIDEMPKVHINILNFQFANAVKLLKTLEKRGKLQDFLCLPDQYGRPNRVAPARRFSFAHRITKDFAGETDKIQKWSKYVQRLTHTAAVYYTDHNIVRSKITEDFEVISSIHQCISDLGIAGTERGDAQNSQRDFITRALRRFPEGKTKDHDLESVGLVMQDGLAQGQLAASREQERREVEEELWRAENDYEDNDVDMPDRDDNEEDEAPNGQGQATFGTMGMATR